MFNIPPAFGFGLESVDLFYKKENLWIKISIQKMVVKFDLINNQFYITANS